MGTSDPNEQDGVEALGVIPRAASALFEKLSPVTKNTPSGIKSPSRYSTPLPTLQKATSAQDKQWSMKATYVEIYNEQLRDLLLPENTPVADRRQVNIREDTKGRILLTGLQEIQIESVDDLLAALNFGSSIRQTDSTAINAKSSRSHAVFSINLIQRKPRNALGRDTKEKRYSAPADILSSNSEGFVTVDSKLHFVDLAGSERLKNTGAHGDRAREGISINAGLASLGKVISQLSSRQAGSHVSYRDSKLTRLLQDSLGGNAITYMVACVNPAEFHISETLNTVQYAQRARAIQSKPQIQEVSSDGDLRGLVDRLRAEIAFLRDQIRSSESSTGRSNRQSVDRSSGKELELQNQLLDVQENYSALSQRHAKLISEITKARDVESPATTAVARIPDVAEDRLARSNSFAEAVEQVVLEYEKTIQSLEMSLSGTRTTLSSTESSLLEKEARLVYLETINSQLQSRVQKLADRETSTEVYLMDLENKLNGHATGEERSTGIITELRKELSRVRENEASCEDYISTLEERLAEADQSMDIMQRELDRLEHVVERQRSLGKLDNLLHELDTLTNIPGQTTDSVEPQKEITKPEQIEKLLDTQDDSANEGLIEPEATSTDQQAVIESRSKDGDEIEGSVAKTQETPQDIDPRSRKPDSEAISLSRELEKTLKDLEHFRSLYHSTANDYSEMTTRYEAALKDLHDLQDQLDEHRHGHIAMMADEEEKQKAGEFDEEDDENMPLASPRSIDTYILDSAHQPRLSEGLPNNYPGHRLSSLTESSLQTSLEDVEHFQRAERDGTITPPGSRQNGSTPGAHNDVNREDAELEAQYLTLQDEHRAALELIDELKTSISKSRADGVVSPSGGQVLRRKSSQNFLAVDRANRAFKSLRSLALQHLGSNEDALEVFDLNVNAAVHELHARSERIQELEHEVSGLRKDTEAKTAMINGLARERSSITNSPMDISVMSSLQSRLVESEEELQRLHSKLKLKEEEYKGQISDLKAEIERYTSIAQHGATVSAESRSQDLESASTAPTNGRLDHVSNGNAITLEASKTAENPFADKLSVIDALARLNKLLESSQTSLNNGNANSSEEPDQPLKDMLSSFQANIVECRDAAIQQQKANTEVANILTYQSVKLRSLKSVIYRISGSTENVDESQTSTPESYNIDKDFDEITEAIHRIEDLLMQAQQQEQLISSIEEQLAREKEHNVSSSLTVEVLEKRVNEAQSRITLQESHILELKDRHGVLEHSLQELLKEKSQLESERDSVSLTNKKLEEEIARYVKNIDSQKKLLEELQELHTLSQKELDDLLKKEATHAGVIDQLEQQLASTYDQHQDAQKRLSEVESRLQATDEEKAKMILDREAASKLADQHIENLTSEIASLQAKLADTQLELTAQLSGSGVRAQRSNSVSSTNLRKSASTASLPSPPPVIPLPPLPAGQSTTSQPAPAVATVHSAPPATPTVSRRPSKDYVATHLEDQEARIKTLEKQLQAEKALTATLEEALTDCEKTIEKLSSEKDNFQRKVNQTQMELDRSRNDSQSSRYSMQAMEDERLARLKAEKAKEALEERMQALSSKKKSRNFACF